MSLPVDEIMAKCPLKHEIRTALWQKYIQKLCGSSPLQSYLTLYSPPLMDVKLFADKGLIEFDGDVYKGVVGATYDKPAYAKAIRQLRGRLELLLPVDINKLLSRPISYRDYARQFNDHFPFQAINLDYTNSLFTTGTKEEISVHLQAIDALLKKQKDKDIKEFVLFVTTRAEKGTYNQKFLDELKTRIKENIDYTVGFKPAFVSSYNVNTEDELARADHNNYISLGIVKFLAQLLVDYQFVIQDCDAKWLTRSNSKLLHLALHIKQHVSPAPSVKLSRMGKRKIQYEKEVIAFMAKTKQGIEDLREDRDRDSLNAKHSTEISKLSKDTFELDVPIPTSQDS
jgi:hypothetical protein